MNADTASPTSTPTPAPVPTGPSLPVVPAPGATQPPHTHEHVKAEPNALLEGTKKLWAGLKEGKVGNPRVIALVLAGVAIVAAWWFLARASSQTDSALWYGFDTARNNETLKTFADDPSQANTSAAKIAKLNDLRLRKDTNLQKLTAVRLADRVSAADTLEKLRDELADLAGQFDKDRTMKAQALLAAADVEMGLIGVPKKGVATMGVDVKGNCRGQIEKYAELMRKAADAIGATTDAGKQFLADADKYSKDPEAGELYRRLGTFHAKFSDPDPLPEKPAETSTDPNAPKPPVTIPGTNTPKADEKKPDETPKAPTDPFKGEKKPEEKK